MCVCNMKAIRLTVSDILSRNETRTHRRTATRPDMVMTISPAHAAKKFTRQIPCAVAGRLSKNNNSPPPHSELRLNKDAVNESPVRFVRYDIRIYRSHSMLYRFTQRSLITKFIQNFELVIPPSHIPDISSFPMVYDS